MTGGRASDVDLRARFDALREADASSVPAFEEVVRSARRSAESPDRASSSTARTWVAAGAVAAAIAVTLLLVLGRGAPGPDLDAAIAEAKEISSWSAPTDTFLDSTWTTSDSPSAPSADRP